MTADIAKYVIVYMIIIMAFSSGLARLYQYYDGMIQVDEQSGKFFNIGIFIYAYRITVYNFLQE